MRLARLERTAILDANGVIGLAKAERLLLLPELFAGAIIPSRVAAEILDPLSVGALRTALDDWLREADPDEEMLAQVPPDRGPADQSVLALSLQHPGSLIVSGDRGLARSARQLTLDVVDAPRVVQLLTATGIAAPARPGLDLMRSRDFGIPQALYETILRELGEL
jgi:predicted nucleic acid-binding protein